MAASPAGAPWELTVVEGNGVRIVAGAVRQRRRNYGVTLAVVRSPDTTFNSRFGEMVVEEQGGPHFRLFDTADAAREWLARP